jgi:hypothetical protein
MLPAIAWALATSSILYVVRPRMPIYDVTSVRIVYVALSFLWTFQLTATIQAGMQIRNENFVGADVHAAVVDIFYPDWHNVLQHIGELRDAPSLFRAGPTNDDEEETASFIIDLDDDPELEAMCQGIDLLLEHDRTEELDSQLVDRTKQCSAMISERRRDNLTSRGVHEQQKEQHQSTKTSDVPFLSVDPRGWTKSEGEVVSIQLRNMNPSTYLRFVWDAISNGGKVLVPAAGVAHLKSKHLPLPLTVGIMCDNEIDFRKNPWMIAGKECIIERIATGWSHIAEHGLEIRLEALRRYQETGSVLDRGSGKSFGNKAFMTNHKAIESSSSSSSFIQSGGVAEEKEIESHETIISWHDF